MAAVLVTGGAGYIGAHICKRLAAGGARPLALDNLSTGDVAAVKWGPLIEGSIEDSDALLRLRVKHKPIAVIHAAALSDVVESVRDPMKYWRVNVGGTAALREVFADLPFVFSSSAAVYGESPDDVAEDHAPSPLNPYGQSKMECESLLPNAMRLRYFNVAGADEDVGLGHKPQTNLIPRLLRAAMTGGVFQLDGDGEAVRDFVHVSDVADASVLALRALLAGKRGLAVNICSGQGHSVTDVIRLAVKITQRRIGVTRQAPRPGDAARLVGKNALALDVLGWAPKRDLAEQVASAWNWIGRESPAMAAAS